ncbi:MAG: DNA-processing protein DprA [Fimbriimonadaceae bacterium]
MVDEFWQLLMAAEVSPAKGRALIEAFGPCSVVSKASFAASPLLTPVEAAAAHKCDLSAPNAAGAKVVHGSGLPSLLAALDDAPPAFFALGDTACLHEPCVAIVGTRNASTYGRAVARKFASALANAGAAVVSGGAVGIDTAAHEGALAAEGPTVAVLAGGVDRPYPAKNAGLFRRMAVSGCLVSSYACGTLAERHKFVDRNELIAGLCHAVVVVEAPERSGALTTAVAARRFGRPVFVAPANIEAASFRGSHQLIRAGATLVDDPDQLLTFLGLANRRKAAAAAPTSELAERILAALTTSPIPAEKLAEIVRLTPQALLAELTMLELDARVIREPGGYALMP